MVYRVSNILAFIGTLEPVTMKFILRDYPQFVLHIYTLESLGNNLEKYLTVIKTT